MLDRVRALGFDVFGTCVDWRSGVSRAAAAFLRQIGGPDISPEALADAWRGRYQPAMEACRSGRRPYTRLSMLNRELLEEVLHELGLDPSAMPVGALDELNLAWERLDPWQDVVAGLSRLKRRFIIVPLSNANFAMSLNMARRAGLPWDAIMGAELTHAYKPQAHAYLGTADLLGLAPAELGLVAAHNADLAAARHFGLATLFVPRPGEHGPHKAADVTPAQEWDLIAPDFNGLADALGC
jgi:2-haloacid dehalogenase